MSSCSKRLLPLPVVPQMTRNDKHRGQSGQISHDASSGRAIAAFKLTRLPADTSENVRHRTAAVATAPAVNERPPCLRHRVKQSFQMQRDIARDVRSAATARLERRLLAIHRSHFDALGVGEYRATDRAGHVIDREFILGANVDQRIELRQLNQRIRSRDHAAIGRIPCAGQSLPGLDRRLW